MRRLYSPQLSEANVQRLYRLKQQRGRSMTSLLNEILDTYLSQAVSERPAATSESPQGKRKRKEGAHDQQCHHHRPSRH